MPELPEVEAARVLIQKGCVGKRIENAIVASDEKVFDGATPEEVRRALEGRRVLRARRKGKYLWLELDNEGGQWPLLHFGMTGGIVVQNIGVSKYKRIHLESDPEQWPPKATKLQLEMEGGGRLAYVDARRFGRIKLQVDPPSQEPLSRLGFDVLDEMPPLEGFVGALRKRVARAPTLKIKALLLDQEFCSGIGNWVGDEVLYQSRIHPEQSAASLDDTALAALYDAIRSVVRLAVEVDADSGSFPKDWLFHFRWTGKRASSINGNNIEFVTMGSRTSAFVPAVQKLTGGGGTDGEKAKETGPVRSKRGKKAASKRRDEMGEEEGEDGNDGGDDKEQEEDDAEEKVAKAAPKRRTKSDGKPAATAVAIVKPPQRGSSRAKGREKVEADEAEEDEEQEEEEAGEEQEEGSEGSETQDDDSDDGGAGDGKNRKAARGKASAANKQTKAAAAAKAGGGKATGGPRARRGKAA